MAIVLRCAALLLLAAVLLGSASAYHEVDCCNSCGIPFTPVVKFRVLCPDDVTQECYYNAAIDNWYYWTNVDYNEPGPHVGSFALYKTGIMGMGYEQSLGGDCGNPLCTSDTTGANMFIYIEPASRNCAQLGTAAMAGQYCDVVSGFAPTCRVGTITRHFQSYHTCSGAYLDCVSAINVQDTTAPYLGLPPDTTLECGSDTSPTVTGTPYVYDRCDTAVPTLTRADTVTTPTPCITSISRAWTASDNCGNRQTQTQTITVADTLPPVFTSWPADTTVPCATNLMGFTPATPTAADVCVASPAVTMAAPNDVNRVCPNQFVRQWVFTATDAVGCNTATHTVSAIVSDTLAPTITGITDGAYNEQDCRPAALTPGATDNCDTITPIYTEEVVPIPGRVGYYDLHRLAVATDSCGNTARASDLVRYSLRAAVSISPPAVASVAFANPVTFQVTVTWTPAGTCTIPDGSFFMYFEPFPFTAAVTGLTCETVTVGGGTVTPGEVRCAIPTAPPTTSPQSYSVTLTPPAWLVTSQQWKINFGVASTTWANIAPLSTAVITIN